MAGWFWSTKTLRYYLFKMSRVFKFPRGEGSRLYWRVNNLVVADQSKLAFHCVEQDGEVINSGEFGHTGVSAEFRRVQGLADFSTGDVTITLKDDLGAVMNFQGDFEVSTTPF